MNNGKRVCLVPGSFDPPTLGHRYIAERASATYDEVLVVGFINEEKQYTFSEEERRKLMEAQFGDIPKVTLDFSRGMLADYCREKGVDVILKGVRNEKDVAYERDMAERNHDAYPVAVTVLLHSPDELCGISSTGVRELLASGGDVSHLLGERTAELAVSFFKKSR
jgi:pantetheine-phosphate adenylyltransferase